MVDAGNDSRNRKLLLESRKKITRLSSSSPVAATTTSAFRETGYLHVSTSQASAVMSLNF